MPTTDIPAQNLDRTGVAAGVKRFRADMGVGMAGFDIPLLFAALALVVFSLVTLTGATRDDVPGSPHYYVLRQSIFAAAGLGAMLVVARLDYVRLRDMWRPIYGLLIGSILVVFLVGATALGSRRWLDLGIFQFQPSELGKLLIIIVLAGFLTERARDRSSIQTTLAAIGLAALPAALIFIQPDLGSAMVYGAITLMMLFVAGTSWQQLTAIFAIVVLLISLVLWAAPAAGVNVLKEYQVARLTSFLHPSENRDEYSYQQTQAQIAIGAGERTGRGSEGATQSQLNFLPEHRTDFVFAVVGESYGFAGAASVLTLYALLIWRSLRILASSRDQFGSLIAAGIAAVFIFQVFVNVGMNVGIMPITGVTLPLMSYGGSSMVVTFIALGLLQAIALQASGPRKTTI
ncbi:MAG: rod shape-determining protein RodA [Thermoleophilaceae bacterium]|nr:rod shape-determining protein RodA [Thermoleophilaceae bacterium]